MHHKALLLPHLTATASAPLARLVSRLASPYSPGLKQRAALLWSSVAAAPLPASRLLPALHTPHQPPSSAPLLLPHALPRSTPLSTLAASAIPSRCSHPSLRRPPRSPATLPTTRIAAPRRFYTTTAAGRRPDPGHPSQAPRTPSPPGHRYFTAPPRRRLLAWVGVTGLLAAAGVSQASKSPGGSRAEEMLAATGAAVNLRDIAEAAPGKLRKGVVYRCSQIYSREVLHELHIRTIVDLRGRAPTRPSHKHAGPSDEAGGLSAHDVGGEGERRDAAATAAWGRAPGELAPGTEVPPSLLDPDFAEQLQQGGGAGIALTQGEGSDMVTITRPRSSNGVSNSPAATSSINGTNNGVPDPSSTLPPPASLDGSVAMEGEAIRQSFNLIPNKEFGLRLLRFPPRVWAAAVGNLVRGKDARKPFVDAFADDQILGFTRYYILILEHSKRNIAAVLRLFAQPDSLPALVHCAHGKDRTGVIVMLLMLLCGLEPEEVTADYELSEVQLRQYRESLGIQAVAMAVIPLDDVIVASTRETIRAVMEYLLQHYLTAEDYLLTTGLTPQELAAIRRNLMQPAAIPAAAAGVSQG